MMVNPDGSRDFFNQYRIFNVGAMFRLINCGIPQNFPKLRFGFIETAATWVPWVDLRVAAPLGHESTAITPRYARALRHLRNLSDRRRRAVSDQELHGREYLDDRHGLRPRRLFDGIGSALTTLKDSGGISAEHASKDRRRQPAAILRLGVRRRMLIWGIDREKFSWRSPTR